MAVPYQFAGEGPVGDVKPETILPRQDIRATPEAFGAGKAQALQQVGKTAEQLGHGALELSQFYGQVAVDDGANKLQEALDRLKHGNPDTIGEDGQPETGFMGKRGALAMDHYKPTLDHAEDAVKAVREALPMGPSQAAFDRVARGMIGDFRARVGSHYEQQGKVWAEGVNKATLANSLTEIARQPDSDEVFNNALADGFNQAEKTVHLAGGGEPELKAAKDAVMAAARKTQIESIGVNEPKRALQMTEEYKAELGAHYDEVANKLRHRADEQGGNAAGAKAFAVSHGTHAAYNPRQPIFAQAATQGPLSSRDLARFVQIEWPGRNNPKNPSHQGPGQFSEATARQVGIVDRNDFGQSVMGIQRYAAMNAPILARALGRRPTAPELYLAHQQGPGGAAKLFANPDARAGDLVGDAAIKGNGGNPNAPARAFTSMWVRKFGGDVNPQAVTGEGGGIEIPEATGRRAMGAYTSTFEPQEPPHDITPPHLEQVKIDAYRSILDDPNLNDGERRHALQTIHQLSAVEEISEHAAEKAKKEANDLAADQFAQAALAGKFEGLVEAISSDPRLSDWHTRASLVGYVRAEAKRQATGEDEGYGKGYAEIYHRVVARAGDPERIADPAEIYRLADEGGPLTGNGAAKLAAVLREIKRPESASAHTTFSQIMNEAKKEVSFEQVYGDYKIPDIPGERNYAYRIFPEMQQRFDRLMREGGDTQKFFLDLPQEVRKMRDSLRSPTEAARDRMAALTAAGNSAEGGAIAPAPPHVDAEKWRQIAAAPPLAPSGKPFKSKIWGDALTMLTVTATPKYVEQFDKSAFGQSYKGKEILDMLGISMRESMEGRPDILAAAKQKYPFIEKHNPVIKVSPREGPTFAETFPPGEEGAGDYLRPKEFPIGSTGIEIYKPDKFSAEDLAAEFLHADPKAHEARAALVDTLTDHQLAILKKQPDYENMGGNLSDQKRLENVVDAMMRGYTVGQWPKQAIDELKLTEKQREILDELKKYMTTAEAR